MAYNITYHIIYILLNLFEFIVLLYLINCHVYSIIVNVQSVTICNKPANIFFYDIYLNKEIYKHFLSLLDYLFLIRLSLSLSTSSKAILYFLAIVYLDTGVTDVLYHLEHQINLLTLFHLYF